MKKNLYYILPFIVIPILMLPLEVLNNIEVIKMSPYILGVVLMIISAVFGFLSTTDRLFDYLMIVIMPLSFFCFMFAIGFLGEDDLGYRFYLYKALQASFQPIALQFYFLMAMTTFLTSFRYLRNLKKHILCR